MSMRLSRTFYTLGGIRINTAIVFDLYKNTRQNGPFSRNLQIMQNVFKNNSYTIMTKSIFVFAMLMILFYLSFYEKHILKEVSIT